ncbi:DEAD/DEAH box helicase family protein [Mycolicibacterium hassiacum DSM 44199]|uniref:DEAD/DEAH box helicase family protein n=1 Tax=Mycolicibacterium hassiacum (strain DSM 44199 / CIP 105218 / JCM 12690 / 3849) TaxID=1122247 RepID=K5BB55_MYCHD|nr:helicase-related protein [Mycolicibacterium hassiacum]EKF23400.1 DEAD/DEAH box helicase family protein [Mycolicibacterium hassiacum DSM 44199]MDA4087661.1 helicase [Mycolicibacterium hassiacum DSM 44199]VCT91021.1 RNA polymerase-associated protein RapA [Mycolicibacterium hassiacum DSM 44199]
MGFAPGNLVTARGREWVVLPESTDDFLVLRPIGGIDDDIAGVLISEGVSPASFPPPRAEDLGDHLSASLLRNALRIGFRSTAGPFRSLASIAVEPRAYQLVPLMMALRQDVVRLLIADDVGIGKTIEAALVATELLKVGDARGLTVLCSPALAEQWQSELRGKFGLEAELVLPSTVRRLERGLIGAESIFERYPITVVSTDFIKSSRRRHEFLRTCPDLVIVDEVHTCVADSTSSGSGRTQRYELIRDLAAEPTRHMILASATPHSGKDEVFRNLLGLLKPELANVDLEKRADREELAKYFVQRRRVDIRRYLDEDTPFPKDRLSAEVPYSLSPEYHALFSKVLDYARETVRTEEGGLARRVNWWSALALLRALASSPRAAAQTLQTRAATVAAETPEEADAIGRAVVLDLADDEAIEAADTTPGAGTDSAGNAKSRRLQAFRAEALKLEGKPDHKVTALTKSVKELLRDGFNPIVFCRFIDTADYVAEQLGGALGKNVTVRAVTGTLPPAERVARIEELTATPGQHVLIATDCLSEGVNLQENFQAVVHYDLAWNPTRHEQREGRVDRFGQRSDTVRTVTLYGRDNQIDGIVLEVLLRKHEAIRKATGVAVPVPDNSDAVVEALMEGLLLRGRDAEQLGLELDLDEKRDALHTQWESAAARERNAQTKYAQHGIKPQEVAAELAETRATLGTNADVAEFVEHALRALRSSVTPTNSGFTATLSPLPLGLRDALPPGRKDPLHFATELPVARGEAVLTRTDATVEAIANYVLESALDSQLPDDQRPARRCAVVRTKSVSTRTTLLVVRYRFHLHLPSRTGSRELVAEDVATLAYEGPPDKPRWLATEKVAPLLTAKPSGNIPAPQAAQFITRALDGLPDVAGHLAGYGEELAVRLRESHRRVRRASAEVVRGLTVTVEPGADVLGVFVYVPPAGGAQ